MAMNVRGTKETLIRIALLFAGLVVAHFGVTLFLLSDLGADPFNVLIQGLFRSLRSAGVPFLTHGITHMAVCFLIIVILLAFCRSYVRLGTFLCMFAGGPIIDFFTWLLQPLSIGEAALPVKLAVLSLGCVILAFGMTIVIKSDAGTGPNDLVAVVLSDVLHRRFRVVRIATDVAFVLAGALLGGVRGIGTLVCAFLVGPAADFFLPRSEKIVGGLLGRVMKTERG